MHELGLTRNIVAIVAEQAGDRRVRRVTLHIGRLTAVLPDAVTFCFDVVSRGTVLEGARLEIVEIPGRGRCRGCGLESELGQIPRCPCGSRDLEALAGNELSIKEMELEVA